jgi:hypothetical protein
MGEVLLGTDVHPEASRLTVKDGSWGSGTLVGELAFGKKDGKWQIFASCFIRNAPWAF